MGFRVRFQRWRGRHRHEGAPVATYPPNAVSRASGRKRGAPRRRTSRGRVALVATESVGAMNWAPPLVPCAMARAPSPRGCTRSDISPERSEPRKRSQEGCASPSNVAREGRACRDRKRGRNELDPSTRAMRDGEGAIATIPARECKTSIYQPSSTNYQLSSTNYQLSTINYQLSTTNYQLPTTIRRRIYAPNEIH